ncbi:MAG: ABC-type multidrug transport system ATPase subunit [Cyclobacteriaceae bacterium]|jgi:ABC-type multidrug transport system ATPase subunit
MKESIINALVHLFAIIESAKDDLDEVDSAELIVKPYLKRNLNQELTDEYLRLFHDYLSFYSEENTDLEEGEELGIDPTSILQVAKICNQLNKELLYSERIVVFMQLLELINADKKISARENEFIALVAMNFNLKQEEANGLIAFTTDPQKKGLAFENTLIINNKMTEWPEEVAWMMRKKSIKMPGVDDFLHLYVENLFGEILVYRIQSVNTYVFKYTGPLNLYIEGNKLVNDKFYLLKPGAIIKGPNIKPIYETDIIKEFINDNQTVKIVMMGEDLEFQFKRSSNGLHKFNFSVESGHLVGVMGGSGVGKSTLINLLNGKISPTKGKISINGYSINRASNEGVIGYVPQDDMLFNELTVHENLYFNAQICFSDFTDERIRATVDNILEQMDLMEIKDLKVGDPLNKFISGGQRKRLNIALELMREPSVLFVDEPTSGLSSMDSEKVMLLLKNLARSGKLVFCIIHQPSSDIFKLFDKLWILDKGGYPVYRGNPVDAVVYFKTMSTQVNAAESECTKCGNVIPEQILQIIEAKEINDSGQITKIRRVSPIDWYEKYKVNIESKKNEKVRYIERLPPSNFNIPGLYKQFAIFGKRNLFSKLSNRQYIVISLLQTPLLALILGYFTKYAPTGVYTVQDNKNLPVYLFMAVVVSLFTGMSISAEEIFKDRKILERESFLNLSRFSYINAKVFYLLVLSGIQSLAFVLVGNYALEIEGMTFYYWLILFSTSCFANLIGLNISSALNSIITIYILIPFILVPQLLLGGAMIKFDELQENIARQEFVPFVGDIMVSRWAYEAIAVAQFKHNAYEKHFFQAEKKASQASFQRSYVIPKLEALTVRIIKDSSRYDVYADDLSLIKNEVNKLSSLHGFTHFPFDVSLNPKTFNSRTGKRLLAYLGRARDYFQEEYKIAMEQKDAIYDVLVAELGKDEVLELMKANHNESISNLVQNRSDLERIVMVGDHLVQKKDPIFKAPPTQIGRAHFYANEKQIGVFRFDTVLFNMFVIWMMTGLLYLTLYHDTLKKIINYFSRLYTKYER